MNNASTPGNEEISLLELIQTIWRARRVVFWSAGIGALLGLIVAICIPNEYTSTMKMIAESPKNRALNELGSLASLAGINLSTLAPEEPLNTSLYPDIVNSTPFLSEMSRINVGTSTLYQYCYRLATPFWEKHAAEPAYPASSHQLERKEWRAMNEMKKRFRVETDKKSGIVTVSVTLRNAATAAIAVDSLVSKLHAYILNYRTEKARRDYAFTLGLYEEAGVKYREAQQQYARFVDAHQHSARESVNAERIRLNNEQQLAYGVYSSMAQQLELARINVQEQTPSITVIEPAAIPPLKSAPRRSLILTGFILIGIIAATTAILLKSIFTKKCRFT